MSVCLYHRVATREWVIGVLVYIFSWFVNKKRVLLLERTRKYDIPSIILLDFKHALFCCICVSVILLHFYVKTICQDWRNLVVFVKSRGVIVSPFILHACGLWVLKAFRNDEFVLLRWDGCCVRPNCTFPSYLNSATTSEYC